MPNFTEIMQAFMQSKKLPKLQKISDVELKEDKQVLLDFDALVNYDARVDLAGHRLGADLISKGLFFNRIFLEKTADYNWRVQTIPQLLELEEGQRFSHKIKLNNGTNARKIYSKATNRIKQYIQLMQYTGDVLGELPASQLQEILSIDGAVKQDDCVFFTDPKTGEKYTCKIGEENLTILGHDDRENPFKNGNFRIFDSNGEIENFDNIDFYKMLCAICKKMARNYDTYNYLPQAPYGGKIVQISNSDKVALFSNAWQEEFCNIDPEMYERRGSFKELIIPQFNKPIRTDEDCEKVIDNIRTIEIYTKQKHEQKYVKALIEQAVVDYDALADKSVKLEDFMQMRFQKLLGNATVYITTPEQTKFLRFRLVGNKNFYAMSRSEKENLILQKQFINSVATKFYTDGINRNAIAQSGQLAPMKVDLPSFVKMLKTDLRLLESGKQGESVEQLRASINLERQIGLAMFNAYKNLLHNQFIGDLLLSADLDKNSEEHKLKVCENLKSLENVDASMFKTFNNRVGTKSVETISEKRVLLAAIRQAILQNNVNIQFDLDFCPDTSKLVFYDMNGRAMSASITDFMQFVNSPLFVNHKSQNNSVINAQNEQELLTFISKLSKQNANKFYKEPEA